MAARHDLIRLRRTNGFMALPLAVGSVTTYRRGGLPATIGSATW